MHGSKNKFSFKLDQEPPVPKEKSTPKKKTLKKNKVNLDKKNKPEEVERLEPVFNEGSELLSFGTKSANKNSSVKDLSQENLQLDLSDPDVSAGDPDVTIQENEPKIATKRLPAEELVVINVIAHDVVGFKGPALLQNILESGLRFGEMSIFHRHENMAGHGEILFSMSNALKPGIFNLDDIEGFSTRAVSFFMELPGPKNSQKSFTLMIQAAKKLANELHGELKDDQHSVMTAQTIEHYRQRVVEFERRRLAGKR
ncbi:UNVERIFIED_CONTAM: hypothetical protein GTU68_058549 [Idotea baltica]|nr:hypothetical protein [Idotea baltica]